ncbi:MAG TPA: flavin-dependent monooxygenase [Stellaceae bacterium]|nr:flavin-dependent monooxygenase [Stellaceae bacterium]
MDTVAADTTTPTRTDLIARARAMVPVLAKRAAQAEQDRAVPKETIAEMNAAGLFRVLQPRRWGGYEMPLDVANDIQMILAEGCMSSAWIYAVLTVEPFLIALCDDRMAQDVWGKDESVLVCGTSAGGPGNKAIPVEGGFRLSGRWRFASGSDHTDWTFLGGCHVADPAGGGAEWRVLLPRSDYQIVDTWYVSGLKATGSRDIVVEDKFIPAHRAIKQQDLFLCRGPGQALNTAALYRIPFGQVFAISVSTLVIGGLQGMLDAFIGYGLKRIARGIGPTAGDPVAQSLCAEAAVTIDECKIAFNRNIANLTAYAERGEVPPLQERLRYKFQVAFAVERASLLAARIFKAAGASGIYVENTPFARFLADINAGRQHVNNQIEAAARNWGRVMLGGAESENRDIFL